MTRVTPPDPSSRFGIDVLSVPRLAKALDRGGDAFTRRIVSERESRAWGHPPPVHEVAAHLAVKEAVIKALGGRWPGFRWTDIEITEGASATPEPAFTRAVDQLARAASLPAHKTGTAIVNSVTLDCAWGVRGDHLYAIALSPFDGGHRALPSKGPSAEVARAEGGRR